MARSEVVAPSEEVVLSEEVARSEEVALSEEVARSEEVAGSEEMAAAGLSVTVTHSERGLPGGLRAGPRKSGGVSGFGRVPCPSLSLESRRVGSCGTGFFFFLLVCQHTFPRGRCILSQAIC